jgi:hypothetical protein
MVRKPVALVLARSAFDDFELLLPLFLLVLIVDDKDVNVSRYIRNSQVSRIINCYQNVRICRRWWHVVIVMMQMLMLIFMTYT